MKKIASWWLPDDETHLTDYLLREDQYQHRQRAWALRGLARGGHCVDVGAHVGLWLRDLCDHFDWVWAIEPRPIHHQCLEQNVMGSNYTLIKAMAGDSEGHAGLEEYGGNSGHTHWRPEGVTPVIRIDSLEVTDLQFIKIDVEGFELPVIKGAEQCIRQQRPRICLEQKPHPLADQFGGRFAARDLLTSWGYRTLQHHGDDYVMRHPEGP